MSAAVTRRMQMVILSAPRVLESVRAVTIRAPISNENYFSGLSLQFIPWLRLHNSQIEWKWDTVESKQGVVEIAFTDNTTTIIEENQHGSYHEICQALLDADSEKSAQLKTS